MARRASAGPKEATYQLCAEVPAWMIEALDKVGDQEDRTRSWLVRKAIVAYLEQKGFAGGN
jgi:predicted transcriptional regulator